MALDYSLNMGAKIEPIEALQILAFEIGLKWNSQGGLFDDEINIGASTGGNPSFEEDFGFTSNLSVWFRFGGRSESTGNRVTIRATMLLLEKIPGDAVLLLNGEFIELQRLNGELIVNSDRNAPALNLLLQEITLPYKLAKLSY